MKTRHLISALCLFAVAGQSQDNYPIPDMRIDDDPIVYYSGLRDALSELHDKEDAVKGYLKNECKLSDADAFRALKYLIEELAGSESFQDKNNRFQAICCIRDYPCEDAWWFLERLLFNEHEPERRTAAYSLTRMALDDSVHLTRLQQITDEIPTENWIRQQVYDTISGRLQFGNPSRSQQMQLASFLLNRARSESQLFDMLDEILCREIPKWRASPQRMENAERMIREHPGDARLVAFFENVRTNALESAQMESVQTADGDSSRRPAGTNATPEDHLPDGADEPAAPPDPWADLLEDLPEKKPSDSPVAPE